MEPATDGYLTCPGKFSRSVPDDMGRRSSARFTQCHLKADLRCYRQYHGRF